MKIPRFEEWSKDEKKMGKKSLSIRYSDNLATGFRGILQLIVFGLVLSPNDSHEWWRWLQGSTK